MDRACLEEEEATLRASLSEGKFLEGREEDGPAKEGSAIEGLPTNAREEPAGWFAVTEVSRCSSL